MQYKIEACSVSRYRAGTVNQTNVCAKTSTGKRPLERRKRQLLGYFFKLLYQGLNQYVPNSSLFFGVQNYLLLTISNHPTSIIYLRNPTVGCYSARKKLCLTASRFTSDAPTTFSANVKLMLHSLK